MNSRKLPALLAVGGLILAVGLFLVLKDDTADEDSTVPQAPTESATGDAEQGNKPKRQKPKPEPKPELPILEVKGGKPVGGPADLKFTSGETARFEVVTDAADELHLHGYDLTFNVKPGKPTEIEFDADIEGLFELESHTTAELLAEISVVPD